MVKIYNTSLFNELTEAGRIQTSVDKIPNEFAEKVIPVCEVNPKVLRTLNVVNGANSVATGNLTAFTTPTDKDFYLDYIALGSDKNVTCDVATGRVYVQVTNYTGQASIICSLPVLTLTAESANIFICFPKSLRLQRNSTIVVAGKTFTAGAMAVTVNYGGYIIDNGGA